MTLPLTPEQREWMDRVSPAPPAAPAKLEAAAPASAVFTDAEIAWLWPRLQKCRFGSGYCLAKSFTKTPLENLTPKGKACLHEVAYRYRRQIFADAANWGIKYFIEQVRRAAS